jgi:excinuclease ABC subunit C
METSEILKEQVAQLPTLAGVYRYFDIENQLLYVGKAKNLKNRVSSYFSKSNQHSGKTRRLVSQIARIEYTVVNSEFDALLLENNLIKTFQPKYNILLKDDKTYPFVCLTNEPFPRLLVERQVNPADYRQVFGPFSNVKAMWTVVELIKQLYPLRTCSFALTSQNIENQKFKSCLEYHIGNCHAPCEGRQTEAEYETYISQIIEILKGNLTIVKQHFEQEMLARASNLEFEQAEIFKQKISLLDNFQTKSLIVNPKLTKIDVFALLSDEEYAYIHYLKIKDGRIIHTQNQEVKRKLEETDAEILALTAFHFRQVTESDAEEIVSNIEFDLELSNLTYQIPKIGDKKKLIDLALKNLMFFRQERRKLKTEKSSSNPTQAVLELQKALNLASPPMHIECFDNSNLQGTNPVAAMVYFQNGKPLKKEYRHYNIKTVEGPDDFASMKEIVGRRYKRILEEQKPLPDLIVIDGGKGQLSHACEALKELGIYGQIPIIGIAKRLEELYLPEDDVPLHLSKKSIALKLIQYARNEAHRFGITFHRQKRSKTSIQTKLSEIKGVGETTVETLLKEFKTIKNIKAQTLETLAQYVGEARAKLVLEGLQ